VTNNEINATNYSVKSTTILIAMQMRRYDAGADHPMEHIQGFTQSQWMPPSGEFSHRHCIAAAAAMADNFGRKHKTLTKNYF
jgi:hypothetical protein